MLSSLTGSFIIVLLVIKDMQRNIPGILSFLYGTQSELFKYIVLELRTFVLKNRLSTFWYQCS